MTIRARIVLLLLSLLALFGLSAAGLRFSHRAETSSMVASLRDERSALLDRLLALTGESLQNFTKDYSLWDEMVNFVRTGDPAWAAINIDPSLTSFDAQAAWVVRTDGSILYSAAQDANAPLAPPPLDNAAFLGQLRRERDLHFFVSTAAGLVEMRTAPILPSEDIQRTQEPRGWFIVARLWNDARLLRLSDTIQSHVSLAPATPTTGPLLVNVIHLERRFTDWNGRPIATLQVEYESPPLATLQAGNEEEAWVFYAFGFVVILVVLLTINQWVLRPLERLSRSLETGDPGPIRELQRSSDEFGHLARQTAESFLQRDALRDNEDRLRQATTLHERLGRDLHDGIIQSIYAAGLGLESARNLLRTDIAAAEARLASCQRMFNDTLWQVRNFIHTIEPETARGQSAAQSLPALVATMQSLQAIPIHADIDRALAARIHPKQELQLLHMTRELLSNALRHSGAKQVTISLRVLPDGLARLEVSDDGDGFDPGATQGTGRGLANLAARARDLDARLEIDSSLGKGARIAVWFRPIT